MKLRQWLRAALAYGLDRVHTDAVDLSEPSLVQVSSAGITDSLAFVGSSPWPVDPTTSFLEVPSTPSDPDNRYLFRVAGWSIPSGKAARLRGFGLYAELAVNTSAVGALGYRRFPITSPGFAFSDGNIAWGITAPRTQNEQRPPSAFLPRGWTYQLSGTTPALITRDAGAYYSRPCVGFPGSPVGHLGLMRDQRATWHRPGLCDVTVEGGHDVVLWCSVKQTDTVVRLQDTPPPGFDLGSLAPEERFVAANPGAAYSRIGGYLIMEVGPSNRNASYLPSSPGRRG